MQESGQIAIFFDRVINKIMHAAQFHSVQSLLIQSLCKQANKEKCICQFPFGNVHMVENTWFVM